MDARGRAPRRLGDHLTKALYYFHTAAAHCLIFYTCISDMIGLDFVLGVNKTLKVDI